MIFFESCICTIAVGTGLKNLYKRTLGGDRYFSSSKLKYLGYCVVLCWFREKKKLASSSLEAPEPPLYVKTKMGVALADVALPEE